MRRGLEAGTTFDGSMEALAEHAAGYGRWRIDIESWTIAWSAGIAGIFDRPMPASGRIGLDTHIGYYHPEDQDAIRGNIRANIEQGFSTGSFVFKQTGRVMRPDGSLRDVLIHAIASREDERGLAYISGVTVDVTEIIALERRAKASVDLLRSTLENIDQGLLMMDADNRIKIWNRRAIDLVGIPEDLLYDDAPFGAVLDHLVKAGEYLKADPVSTKFSRTGAIERHPTTSERRRPNGTVLEIRSSPTADGGVVRTFLDVTVRRDAELAAREGEIRYRLLAENTTDVIIGTDAALNRHYVSPSITGLLGYEPHEVMGRNRLPVHPEDHDDYEAFLSDLVAGRRANAVGTARYRHRDGHYIWGEISVTAVGGRDGQPIAGFVASVRDVSDRKTGELALRLSEERLALAIDSGSDGLWDFDPASGQVRLSGQWLGTLGLDPRGIVLSLDDWTALAHPDDRAEFRGALDALLTGTSSVLDCECRMRAGVGAHGWVLTRGKVVLRDRGARPLRVIGTHIDVTRRKEAERLVSHMALHDALTGLPNRTLFRDHLARELRDFKHHGSRFAVLACDLDQFKAVNDTLGHLAGDVLLCEVAKRIVAAVRACDVVARLGGDEFALVLGRLDPDQDDAGPVASRIIEAVSCPVEVEGLALVVGISIGIATVSETTTEPDQLFKQADIAMYGAKAAGRNTYRVFEPGMDVAVSERIALERELRSAVERSALHLAYQPVFSVPDGRLLGCEVLLRWTRAGGRAVPPAEFIPIAEETGLIVPIGAWVLREACRQAAGWPEHLRVAVNVSSVQFGKPGKPGKAGEAGEAGLEDLILTTLAAAPLAPHRLEIEITESVLLRDADVTVAALRRLQAAGIRIALDDFGTGYSSLNYLRRFPFDKIKIDKAFVDDIDDPGTAAIVRAVVGLGARVGADVTAEGIETADQLRRVAEEGCSEAQGFFLGRPMAPDDFARLF